MFLRKTLISGIFQVLNNVMHLSFGLALAYYFGASSDMDSYVVSSNFILALNALFMNAQGSTFIPYISKFEEERRKDVVESILSFNFLFFCFLSLALFLFSKQVVFILAPGLELEPLLKSSFILKILSSFILLSNLGGIASALLDFNYKFEKRYLVSFVQGFTVLILLLVCVKFLNIGIYAVPVANLASIIISTVFLYKFAVHKNYSISISLNIFTSSIKGYIKLLFPIMISFFFVWVIRFTDVFLASFYKSGSIAHLSYCQKMNMYLSGAVSIISVIYFPVISKLSNDENKNEYLKIYFKGFQTLFTLVLACAIFLVLFSNNIISLLFERGNFTPEDTEVVSWLMKLYFFAFLCAPLGAFLANGFFSYRKTKIAMAISISSSIVNVVLNLILGYYWGLPGLVIASSLAFLTGNILQATNLKRVNSDLTVKQFIQTVHKPILSGIITLLTILFLRKVILINTEGVIIMKLLELSVFGILFSSIYISFNLLLKTEVVIGLFQNLSTRVRS